MNGNFRTIRIIHGETEAGSSTKARHDLEGRTFPRLAVTAVLLLSGSSVMAEDGDAMAILKAMSDYVGTQQTIELTFDSDIEVITPELEKIQFTNSGKALLKRPDKLHAHRVGGYADVEMVYDGKRLGIDGRSINGYAQLDAEGTIDELIEMLRMGHGVALPGADLLLANSYEKLAAGVQEASTSDGVSLAGGSVNTLHSATSIRTGNSGSKQVTPLLPARWLSQARPSTMRRNTA